MALLDGIYALGDWQASPFGAAPPAPAPGIQRAQYAPPQLNYGYTGYNPQDVGPLSMLASAGQDRFRAFQQTQPQYGIADAALARGQSYAPYLSTGTPGRTLTNAMTAGDYFSGGPQAQSLNFLTQRAPFAETNPYLQSFMRASAQPLIQQFTEQALPAIGNEFSMAGMTGGSRQGIAQGIAARGLADAISRSNLSLASQGYSQGLDAMMGGLGLGQGSYEDAMKRRLGAAALGAQDYESALGRQMSGADIGGRQQLGRVSSELSMLSGAENAGRLGLLPAQIIESLGGQRQAQTQRGIDDSMARWNYAQQLPIEQLSRYASLIGAIPMNSYGNQTTKAPGSLLGTVAGGLGSIGGIMDAWGGIMGGGAGAGGGGGGSDTAQTISQIVQLAAMFA